MRLRTAVALVALASALLGLTARPSLAWGPEAHRVVAVLAERLLQQSDPGVRAKLAALLASDKTGRLTKADIGSEATWADVLRDKSPEARDATAAWHATRLKPSGADIAGACFGHTPLPEGYPASHGPRENCSLDKIAQFTAELKNPATSPFERVAAARFLLNLVADLHDPLLAIDAGDQGGLCVALQVGAKPPVRLATWEETLVAAAVGRDATAGAAALAASIGTAERGSWAQGTPADWLQETHEVAKTVTYGFLGEHPAGKHSFPPSRGGGASCATVDLYRVGPDYEAKALAAIKTQLAKAGVRLAAVLHDSMQ